MKKRLATGITELDKRLDGGVPPGAIVTFVSESRTQAELFLHRLMQDHDTVYVSTIGNEEAVKAEFAKSPIAVDNVKVVYASPDSPIQGTKNAIEKMNDQRLTIINTISDFESRSALNVERGPYQKFLNWIQNLQRRSGGVVFLHRYKSNMDSEYEYVTNSMSDIILELDEEVDGDKIVNYLHMPKCRGGSVLTERVKVKLTDGLSIDTSRDIA
jgi:archaellum biogenesis ATPase FlaH